MPKKTDKNQDLCCAALRTLGLLVQPTHTLGQGFPDLVVAGGARNGASPDLLLVELKCNTWLLSPGHPRWQTTLTPDERQWHDAWRFRSPLVTTNRVRFVLERFGWPDDEIKAALATLSDAPLVRAALRKAERKYGLVEADVMATILYE